MKNNLFTLDVIGAILDFISTYFFVKASRWAWPTGVVAAVVNVVLYGLAGLYADTALNFYYFCAMFYGWHQWSRKGPDNKPLKITHISYRLLAILSAVAVAGTLSVALLLRQYTGSQVPYWDATSTVLSVIAQWLVCQKIIEAWLVWFTVNLIFVGLYFYKHIPAHGVLLVIYLGMATAGYWRWYRLMKEDEAWLELSPSMTSEI